MSRREFVRGVAAVAFLVALARPGPAEARASQNPKENGMDVMEALFTRRSIRKYKSDPIPDELMEQVLRAAMIAPSAGNAQPWHFVVITDRARLDAIPGYSPYAAMARTAPAAVLVCADLSLEKFEGFWVLDCAAAIQNMLLAARSLGLGTVWTGVYPMADRVEAFSKHFNLPDNVKPHSLVVMGWPDAEFKRLDRYQPARVHADTF